jgi:phosphatidylglycerophosphatase A
MSVGMMLLTGFGLGRLRPAPGTWGSLPPTALTAAMAATTQPGWLVAAMLVALMLLFGVACVRYGVAAELVAERKDPAFIVADEIAGQSLALLAAPWVAAQGRPPAAVLITVAACFALFRLLDITKPWLIGSIQRLGGGLGILADDLLAGLVAGVVVAAMMGIGPALG